MFLDIGSQMPQIDAACGRILIREVSVSPRDEKAVQLAMQKEHSESR